MSEDLERFREQWRREVAERQRGAQQPESSSPGSWRSGPSAESREQRVLRHEAEEHVVADNWKPEVRLTSDDPTFKPEIHKEEIFINENLSENDLSALESFEKGVDREHVGKMADAVKHYRDAFKKNERVDKLYREKYFSQVKPYPVAKQEQKSADTVEEEQLMKGLRDIALQDKEEDDEKLPDGPIMHLPPEVLTLMLKTVALINLSDFTKMTFTCTKLAYLGYTTQGIWKALCLKEYGRQHYSESCVQEYGGSIDSETIAANIYNHSWRRMYLERPRIWFNGVYISTCNYLRPGIGETWNAPIHMVTYYRYLRFFDDGTCISLLTTDEPTDVVPRFNKRYLNDNINGNVVYAREDGTMLGHQKGIAHGTWVIDSRDGQLLIETQGSVDRYLFYMLLKIRSSGHNKHNKLKWQRFWSVNKLTQNEGEFSLKHDKAYFFVRTRR
jgi:F-box protein 9